MTNVPKRLQRFVVQRAANRCEYCQLSQEGPEATFHFDHVVPQIDGGPTTKENLALACVTCSLCKGSRRTAIDPATGEEVPLFQPRQNIWSEHFEWDDVVLRGITPTGRATIMALRMNRPLILQIRKQEQEQGRHLSPKDPDKRKRRKR